MRAALGDGVIALVLLAIAQPAIASSDGREEFEQGRRFFEAEEYDAALPQFQIAYERSGRRPSTIIALAQTERALKMYEQALEHFHEYLDTNPDDRAEVEATVALVEELLEAQRSGEVASPPPKVAPTPPPEPAPSLEPAPEATAAAAPPPEEEKGSILKSPVFWIITGAIVVGAGVAIGVAAASGGEDLYGGTTGLVLFP